MGAANSSETLVPIYKHSSHYVSENSKFATRRCDNLKSYHLDILFKDFHSNRN
jgi:hypothetical protein